MKKTFTSFFVFLSIILVFVVVFLIPGMVIPVSEQLLKKLNPEEMKSFFPLLLLLSFYTSLAYWLLIRNTHEKKLILFLKLLLANFIMYPLMGLLEALFWRDAFQGIETAEFIKIFFRFIITFSLFSAYLAIIYNSRKQIEDDVKSKSNIKQVGVKILIISILYFFIYNLFGYFVAWQFEDTRIFYSGSSEMKGFFSAMLQNISDPKFVFIHIFRGLLFGLSGYFFYTILDCSRNKILLIMALIFGGFGFQIILPNPLFPEMVRISHFLETTSSMMVFGFLVGLVFTYKTKNTLKIFSNK